MRYCLATETITQGQITTPRRFGVVCALSLAPDAQYPAPVLAPCAVFRSILVYAMFYLTLTPVVRIYLRVNALLYFSLYSLPNVLFV